MNNVIIHYTAISSSLAFIIFDTITTQQQHVTDATHDRSAAWIPSAVILSAAALTPATHTTRSACRGTGTFITFSPES